MLFRNLNTPNPSATSWEDLAFGAPTIIGFAELCRQRIRLLFGEALVEAEGALHNVQELQEVPRAPRDVPERVAG